MKPMLRTALLATAASASLLAAPTFAQAQQAGEAVDVSEIVVTGSRIRRDTFSAPQPMAVVTSEQIRAAGGTSIGDILLDLPQINANMGQQNSSATLFLSGQARADIRGLGATRTLVLMDGRRLPFSDASSPAVDLNLIPSLMIERIETIAGGASAVYGSEAIAGVVNLIMKKEQDGLEIDVQGGITQESDGAEFRAGANWGGKFLDDRLSVVIGAEYAKVEPIFQRDRDWALPGIRRDTTQNPQTIVQGSRSNVSPYAVFQLRTGGVGTALAVARDIRNPSQIARLSPECSTPTVQPSCDDDALGYAAYWTVLQGKSNRAIVRGYAEYELTDNVSAFVEASYAKVNGYGFFQPYFSTPTGAGVAIFLTGDNAYLNGPGDTAAQLRAIWTAPNTGAFENRGAGLTLTSASSVRVGHFWTEFGTRDVKTEREQIRIVGGMQGEFNAFGRDFNWDWYAQHGALDGRTTSYGLVNFQRVQWATDAIQVGGQVVCRATTVAATAAAAAGCVPWDLINGPSREAVLYAGGVSSTDQEVKQSVAAFNITTELFELPAGPIGAAFGVEFRKEESSFVQDAAGASGQLSINPVGTRAGEYDVKEAYGEMRIPILKDLPFAHELTIELAGRLADYSTIGKTDQYRLAAEWAPFEDIRFRAAQATAVRAPNIVELFAPQSQNFTNTAQDPCDSAVYAVATAAQRAARSVTCAAAIPGWNPATFVSNIGTGRSSLELLQGGNPNLGPETADTYQVGVVIEPRWVRGLQFSLDFFKYNIADQIGTIPVNTLLQNLCYDASTPYASNPFCSLIVRDPTGVNAGGVAGGIDLVQLTNQNVAKIKVEGYDASLAYGFRTADVFDADYGDLAFRLDATWMYRWALQGLPGQLYSQFAGHVVNATPEWKGTGTVQWSKDNLTVSWQTLWIGKMSSTNAFQPTQLSPYYTDDWYKHDLRIRYALNERVDLRAGILNITDEIPPQLPETATGTGTGSSSFDNAGRYFYVGANFQF